MNLSEATAWQIETALAIRRVQPAAEKHEGRTWLRAYSAFTKDIYGNYAPIIQRW